MRKLIVSTYVTLDGKVDISRDWTVPYNNEAAVKYHTELLEGSDGLILGRKTYEIFAGLWPTLSGELPYIDKMNSMAKYVASTTLTSLAWGNSFLLEGDAVEGIAKLKDSPGRDLVMYGCRDLMHSVLERNLIDEYRLLVHPVFLGKGTSFLDEDTKQVDLKLVDSDVWASGLAVLTYQPVR
jgi:dihydrofolate reductase